MLSVASLLSHELASIRATQSLPEDALRRLDFLFSSDGTLDRALEALDGGVTRVTAVPSGRIAWTVASSLSRRPAAELAAIDLRESGVDAAGFFYVVLLDGPGACTCADWAARVIGGERRVCKHALAAALADALGDARCRARSVSDEELARMLRTAFARE
jgi:hypothetical protein